MEKTDSTPSRTVGLDETSLEDFHSSNSVERQHWGYCLAVVIY